MEVSSPLPRMAEPKTTINTSTTILSAPRQLAQATSQVKYPCSARLPTFTELCSMVLEVFPDASLSHVKSGLKRFRVQEEHHVQVLLADMVENGYEKCLPGDRSLVPITEADKISTLAAEAAGVERKFKRDYSSTSWMTSDAYRSQAVMHLVDTFPFLTAEHAGKAFRDRHKCHYAPMHEEVCGAILGLAEEGNIRGSKGGDIVRDAMEGLQLTGPQIDRLSRLELPPLRKSRKSCVHPLGFLTEPILLEEVEYARVRLAERVDAYDRESVRREARQQAEVMGALIECSCCYDDVAFEEMCQCDEGHLFCAECLRRYAEEQLFGQQKTELCCMSTSDDGGKCAGKFGDDMLSRALSKKVMSKLQEAMFNSAVESAGLKNLARCPICDLQAICEGREFRCPAPGCGYRSCRDCGEPPHFPLRCDEVEKMSHADSRKR